MEGCQSLTKKSNLIREREMIVLDGNSKKLIEIVRLAVLSVLLVWITACGNNSSVEIGAGIEQGISIPLAIRALSGGTLNAYVTCDFDSPGAERKAMQVDLTQGTAQATCSDLSSGDTTFYIEFEFESDTHGTVALANSSKTIQLIAGENNLVFEESSYVYLCVIDFSVIGDCELGG